MPTLSCDVTYMYILWSFHVSDIFSDQSLVVRFVTEVSSSTGIFSLIYTHLQKWIFESSC
jgi:hypothetical protein